jgi:hypothetical protein
MSLSVTASRHWSRVDKISKEIDQRQTIPSKYRASLGERLVVACKLLARQPRRETLRSRQEIQAHHLLKKAQSAYLEILDDAPHLFLPYVIATPPKSCGRYDSSEFCRSHKQKNRIRIGDKVKTTLEDIANENEFSQSPHYKIIVEQLFSEGSYDVSAYLVELIVSKFLYLSRQQKATRVQHLTTPHNTKVGPLLLDSFNCTH